MQIPHNKSGSRAGPSFADRSRNLLQSRAINSINSHCEDMGRVNNSVTSSGYQVSGLSGLNPGIDVRDSGSNTATIIRSKSVDQVMRMWSAFAAPWSKAALPPPPITPSGHGNDDGTWPLDLDVPFTLVNPSAGSMPEVPAMHHESPT